MMDSSDNKANVGVPPPVIAILLVGTGFGLHFLEPIKLLARWQLALAIGLPILVVGIILKIISIRVLNREGTDMTFKKASTHIVKHGPYYWSRNPIYVSVLLEFVGLAIAMNSIWLLAMTILQFLYFRFWVIAIEEYYLVQKFGKKYQRYKSRTRRWI